MPPGWFIHKFTFTAITTMAPKIPLAAISTLLQVCAQQRGLVQFQIAAHHQHPALMCPDSLQSRTSTSHSPCRPTSRMAVLAKGRA